MANASQIAVSIILLIVGLGIGYFIGGSAAPAVTETVTQVQTVTQTVGGAGAATVTVTETKVQTVTQTVAQQAGLSGEIVIGALVPLSGALASIGPGNKVAIELAVEDLNAFVEKLGLPIRFRVQVEDSAADPTTALQKLQVLYGAGVRFVVGPMTSSEVSAVKSFADQNKILICSQSSTAVSLAVPDFIFRTVPNDLFQSKAIAKLVKDYGVDYLAVMFRNDPWGKGLAEATMEEYKKLGGTVIFQQGYDPQKTEFSGEVAALNDAVSRAVSSFGKDKVGVLLISFEEAGTIMVTASDYDALMQVTWFGSDGTAGNSKIIAEAGEELARTKHLATIFAPTANPKFMELAQRFKQVAGEDLTTYPSTAYDCVWLIGLAIIMSGSTDTEVVRNVLPEVAKSYFGVTGVISFDENGDRASGSYDIYAVVIEGGEAKWVKVGTWSSETNSITWERRV